MHVLNLSTRDSAQLFDQSADLELELIAYLPVRMPFPMPHIHARSSAPDFERDQDVDVFFLKEYPEIHSCDI